MAHSEGATALHNASLVGNLRVVRWLLEHGAHESLSLKNAMGQTPLDLAHTFGPHPEVEPHLSSKILMYSSAYDLTLEKGEELLKTVQALTQAPAATEDSNDRAIAEDKPTEAEHERRDSVFDYGTPESKHTEDEDAAGRADASAIPASDDALTVVDIAVPSEDELPAEEGRSISEDHIDSAAQMRALIREIQDTQRAHVDAMEARMEARMREHAKEMEAHMEARAETRAQHTEERMARLEQLMLGLIGASK